MATAVLFDGRRQRAMALCNLHYARVAGHPPPLLRALAALDAHVDAAHPAGPELWVAALAAPLLANAMPPRRGRPRTQTAELPDAGTPAPFS